MRPPAKLFNAEEIRSLGGDISEGRRGARKRFYFSDENGKSHEFEDGLLIKTLSVRNLRWDETVVPTIAELERFKAGLGEQAEEELLAALAPGDVAPKETFAPGDVVKVREGDLKHVVGIVQSITSGSGSVVVLPTSTASLGSRCTHMHMHMHMHLHLHMHMHLHMHLHIHIHPSAVSSRMGCPSSPSSYKSGSRWATTSRLP